METAAFSSTSARTRVLDAALDVGLVGGLELENLSL